MLNKKPVFIFAFARGGSDIFMNLLVSHPDLCFSSAAEIHKIFKGTRWDPLVRKIKRRLMYDLPTILISHQNFFNPGNVKPRKPIPSFLEEFIDRIFYYGRFVSMVETHNYYKMEGILYNKEEIANCRLFAKGVNGNLFTIDTLRKMYPDAIFFGLVRHGLAICEGYTRRGFSAKKIGEIYNTVTNKMIQYNNKLPNFHIMKYEEMVKYPIEFIENVYKLSDLDINKVQKFRLQAKKVMNKTGRRNTLFGKNRQVFWYYPDELHLHIKSDINDIQINLLKNRDREDFLSVASKSMEILGYN